jgi:tetratricopeptide (TPR) repeat protein
VNKWARPLDWNSGAAQPAGRGSASPPPALATQYFAFLSYSHQDAADADWLHKELERFRVPSSLAGRLTSHGVIPRRLTPIFRDRHELAASNDLGAEIREALEGSHCLIVLCSPAAAASEWTNAEIELFKRLHPDGCVIAAIVSGEPFASEIKGRESEECLPPALRQKYDRRGRTTGRRAEPLAADLRETGDGRRLGFLKVVAGLLGVGLDELVQRDQLRRQRRLAGITGASFLGMVAALVLAVTAIEARDAARDQRREAESLVEFMLGDLRDKLEPIGRLDALDGVGSRVLEYYSKQDMTDLSDAGLLQRSRALSLMADVATARGDMDGALRLYGEAMNGTAEAIQRDPEDPQRLFEHAQTVFYIAQIMRSRGNTAATEKALREYKRLADRMVALEPDNMRWRMEAQYGDFNLGVALFDQQRYAESSALFGQALETIQALSTADPANDEYQKQLSEALAWLADARVALGQIEEGRGLREQHVSLLRNLIGRSSGDVGYRQRLVLGYQRLGNLYAALGRHAEAEENLRAAVRESDGLVAVEPNNNRWREHGARVRLRLAEYLLASGNRGEAASFAQRGCATIIQLVAEDGSIPQRQATRRDCLLVRAKLAISAAAGAEALAIATAAAEAAKRIESNDRIGDARALAEAHRLLGDIHLRRGDATAANRAWRAGISALSATAGDHPSIIAERAELLVRVGNRSESARLKARLEAMGIRRTDVLRA